MAFALDQLCSGNLRGMFDGPTTPGLDLDAPLVVLNLRAVLNTHTTALGILMTCATAWLQAMIEAETDERSAKRIVVVDEAWRILSNLGIGEWLQQSFKLSRGLGTQNVVVMHRLSDLRAAGAEGSREVRLAEGLLADAETKVIYAQPPDQLAARARAARSDRHRGRAAAAPAARLGALEGRPALVPRPAPALPVRARARRHRRAHGRRQRGVTARAPAAALPGSRARSAARSRRSRCGARRGRGASSAAALGDRRAVRPPVRRALADASAPRRWARVSRASPAHAGDPARHGRRPSDALIPGAVAFYATLAVLLVPLVALGVLRASRHRARRHGARSRLRAGHAARDLGRCASASREPGRLTLGRVDGRLVAAEPRQSVIVVGPDPDRQDDRLRRPRDPRVARAGRRHVGQDRPPARHARRARARSRRGASGSTTRPAAPACRAAGWTPLAGCDDWQGAQRVAVLARRRARIAERRASRTPSSGTRPPRSSSRPFCSPPRTRDATMADVVRWIDTQEDRSRSSRRSTQRPTRRPRSPPSRRSPQRDDRTRSSIYTTAETVLAAYADPGVLASALTSRAHAPSACSTAVATPPTSARPRTSNGGFSRCSRRSSRRSSPRAYERADRRRGKPLDPPLLLVLDECANIAPLRELATLASTGAGQGIQLVSVFQDMAQINAVYGRDRAPTIVSNHRAKVDPLRHRRPADARLRRPAARRRGDPADVVDERRRRPALDDRVRHATGPRARERPARDATRDTGYSSTATSPRRGSALRPWFKDRELRKLATGAVP